MAQGTQRASVWTRGTVTLLVAVWIAVAVGNWIANQEVIQEKLGEGETKGVAQEVSIPEASRKPWEGDVTKLQAALDEENKGSLYDEGQTAKLVVASPVAEVGASNASESTAATQSATVAEPSSYTLVFASYHREAQALALMTQLTTKSITSKIVTVTDTDGSTVYKVYSDEEFSSEEKANAMKVDLVKLGVDSQVVAQ